jgi:orotidine-5'-phosphate decarboxylase
MTKLIFACDVSDLDAGKALIQETMEHVDVVKVGLEAMTAEDDTGATLASRLRRHASDRRLQIMWDMKLHDIESTMAKAARNIAKLGSRFFTIHATACDRALAAVAEAAEEAGCNAMPLAVTVLTDLDDPQCHSRFHLTSETAVRRFAENAHGLGIHGFVCSPKEARIIRNAIPDAYIVTPGIRPAWAAARDEQKRVMTPAQAKQAGADAIVVGRPISQPPGPRTPASAAKEIKEELDAA